jgi:uncharacterized protein (DUF849 family)
VTPLVIEAAVNGVTSKRRNPNVPRTTEEIAADAIACLDAGAAIVHNHTDDGVLGLGRVRHASQPYLEAWAPVHSEQPDAILYPTMAGAVAGCPIADRYAHIVELHEAGVLGMAVCDPGSVNIAVRRGDGSVVPTPFVYENPPAEIDWMFGWCRETGVPVHVSIFEPGFLRMALAHLEAGTLPAKVKLQFYFSGPDQLFGLPASAGSLDVYLAMLGDAPLPWMVGVPGGDVTASGLTAEAIARGGHVRVGLEDHRSADGRTPGNPALVAEVTALAAAAGRPVATSAEAHAALWS